MEGDDKQEKKISILYATSEGAITTKVIFLTITSRLAVAITKLLFTTNLMAIQPNMLVDFYRNPHH
jgi:hypothetical protein